MADILVTGADGQLGREIEALHGVFDHRFVFADRRRLDITDKEAISKMIEKEGIDTIINCAGYTAVDRAETERETADLINHVAVADIARIAKEKDVSLIHISTDYVFDGRHYRPYREDDPPNPASVYGESKLRGEEAIRKIAPKNSLIIRTSWVYSSYGNNFVKTMLRLGKEEKMLGVIYDQIGTPTYARDLARTILGILPHIQNDTPQIYHYTNEGVTSWYDFAKEIMRMAGLACEVNPLETFQYPTPARRPHYSLLNKAKIKEHFDIKIPYWKDALSECLIKIGVKQ